MTLEEFYKTNKPFYIDINTGVIHFPATKYFDKSHAEWFTDLNYQWCSVVRGRAYLGTEDNDHVIIYVNNFNIPGINVDVITYLFAHFPTIKWVGLGCIKGKLGEEWEPQLKVYNNEIGRNND